MKGRPVPRALWLVVLVLAACGGASTGPAAGLDPTVLITNGTTTDTLFFTWRDGQGITGAVTVLPGGTSCTKFLAQADSAYFDALARHVAYPTPYTYTQPWFNPATRPAWTMHYDPTGQSGPPTGGILVADVSPVEPC